MRISDWSSDVCSSDLFFGCPEGERPARLRPFFGRRAVEPQLCRAGAGQRYIVRRLSRRGHVAARSRAIKALRRLAHRAARGVQDAEDRKSAVQGKSVPVRVEPGGRRRINKKTNTAKLI